MKIGQFESFDGTPDVSEDRRIELPCGGGKPDFEI
jgi:hypothetical protein